MSKKKRKPEEPLNEWITRITKKKKVYTPTDSDILLLTMIVLVVLIVVVIELVWI